MHNARARHGRTERKTRNEIRTSLKWITLVTFTFASMLPHLSMTSSSRPPPLSYPLEENLPTPGGFLDVAPGIRWLRMGLPFALDHINLWLLEDHYEHEGQTKRGWTVVDCGVDRPESREQWKSVFATALEGRPIVRVIVTHMHPDHIGLAHWICEHWNAPLWISATDYNAAKSAVFAPSGFSGEDSIPFYVSHGMVDPAFLEHVRQRSTYYSNLVPNVPCQFVRLMDGDIVPIGENAWRCISGYGHAPEHISLHCSALNVLISGDMVLPRISTNISVHAQEPLSNPLLLFLESLRKFKDLPANTFVLPSHGKPFVGLARRLNELQVHHAERLQEVYQGCQASAMTAAQAMQLMFRRELDVHQQTFALGEALAHLHALWREGRVTRKVGDDGAFRFIATK